MRASARIRTPVTESTQQAGSNDGSTSSVATHAIVGTSSGSFAKRTRRPPTERTARSCWPVATVSPAAPAASWSAHSCGAIEVFAWGYRSTSFAAQYAAIVRTLCSIAPRRSSRTGGDRSRSVQPF